jgi:hypothetical protein
MKPASRFCLVLILVLFAFGCASYHVARNCDARWSQLHRGMSKTEVRRILGEPRAMSEPLDVPPGTTNSVNTDVVGAIVFKTLFDGWFERWEYGHFGFMENLLGPSDKAFIVYFGSDGKVAGWRRPKIGPYAE